MNGKWKAICDRCGFQYLSDQLKKEWTGLMTCPACWESRHPQDFIRAVKDEQTVPWTRPEPEDTFTAVCYLDGKSGYAGLAVAGCAIAGNQQYTAAFLTGLSSGYR